MANGHKATVQTAILNAPAFAQNSLLKRHAPEIYRNFRATAFVDDHAWAQIAVDFQAAGHLG